MRNCQVIYRLYIFFSGIYRREAMQQVVHLQRQAPQRQAHQAFQVQAPAPPNLTQLIEHLQNIVPAIEAPGPRRPARRN